MENKEVALSADFIQLQPINSVNSALLRQTNKRRMCSQDLYNTEVMDAGCRGQVRSMRFEASEIQVLPELRSLCA